MANFTHLVKDETKSYVQERARNLSDDVLRKFKKLFERDDKGRVRDWVLMEVAAIRDLWLKSFTNLENIFEKFRYVDIDFDAMIATEQDK